MSADLLKETLYLNVKRVGKSRTAILPREFIIESVNRFLSIGCVEDALLFAEMYPQHKHVINLRIKLYLKQQRTTLCVIPENFRLRFH